MKVLRMTGRVTEKGFNESLRRFVERKGWPDVVIMDTRPLWMDKLPKSGLSAQALASSVEVRFEDEER